MPTTRGSVRRAIRPPKRNPGVNSQTKPMNINNRRNNGKQNNTNNNNYGLNWMKFLTPYQIENNLTRASSNNIKKNEYKNATHDLKKMSKFFSKRVVKFKTPNLSEKPQDVRGNLLYIIIFVILNYFLEIQQNEFGTRELTSIQKTMTINEMNVTFTESNDVLNFLVILFCDYVHDYANSTSSVSAHTLHALLRGGKVPSLYKHEKILSVHLFKGWVEHVTWLHSELKEEMTGKIVVYLREKKKNIRAPEYSALENIFLPLEEGLGQNKKIDETKFICTAIRKNKDMYNNINKVKTNIIKTLLGGASHSISFDQTSKGSSLKVIGGLKNMKFEKPGNNKNNKTSQHKFDISIPLLADLGTMLPSSQVSGFRNVVHDLAINIVNDVVDNETYRSIKEIKTLISAIYDLVKWKYHDQILRDLVQVYILNFNSSFKVNLNYNNNTILKYKYLLSNNGNISIFLDTPGSNKKMDISPVLSASQIQTIDKKGISKGIFKTLGDLNIILYAMRSNSIAVTGDRMAGMMYMFFYALFENNRIYSTGEAQVGKKVINKANTYNLLPRFIFESTTDTIILPSKITGENGKNVSTILGANGKNIQVLGNINDECKAADFPPKSINIALAGIKQFKKGWNTNVNVMMYRPLTKEHDWFPHNSNKNGTKITGKTPISAYVNRTIFKGSLKRQVNTTSTNMSDLKPKPNLTKPNTNNKGPPNANNIRRRQAQEQKQARANRLAKRQRQLTQKNVSKKRYPNNPKFETGWEGTGKPLRERQVIDLRNRQKKLSQNRMQNPPMVRQNKIQNPPMVRQNKMQNPPMVRQSRLRGMQERFSRNPNTQIA